MIANFCVLTWKYLLGEDITVSDEAIYNLYRRSGNPNFDPATGADDNGVDVTVMLSALVKGGIQITHHDGTLETVVPLCFAAHPADVDTVRAVTSIFGGSLLAVDLDVVQQTQTDQGRWDYVAGSGNWGGHAVCVAPGTRVLTDDLRWVPIEDLPVGAGLTAFDEYPTAPLRGSGHGFRRFRRAVVEATEIIQRPCYDLEFSDGTRIRCSDEHQWLDHHGGRWVRTDKIRHGRNVAIRKLMDVAQPDQSWGAGYLAAAFDGEGWIDANMGTRSGVEVSRGIHKMGFTQRPNAMYDGVLRELKERGFQFRDYVGHTGYGKTDVMQLVIGRQPELMRFLSTIRPERLLAKFNPEWLGAIRGKGQPVTCIGKKYVGMHPVVAMRTSTRTYIAEGLASHNCGGAYTSSAAPHTTDETVVTWQQKVGTTDTFIRAQLAEAYVVVFPALWTHPSFQAGVDQVALAAAYTSATGRPFPIPLPVPPPPPPVPVPDVHVDVPDRQLAAAIPHGWLTTNHNGPAGQVAHAISAWEKAKGF